MAAAFFLGQKCDEGRIKISGTGALENFGRAAGRQNLARVHRHEVIEARSLFHIGA